MESKSSATRALYKCEQGTKTDTPHSDHSWVQSRGKRMNTKAFMSSSHCWNYIIFINITVFVPEVTKRKCALFYLRPWKNAVKMLFMSSWNVWLCFHLLCCRLTMLLSGFFVCLFVYTYSGNADHFWWFQMRTNVSTIKVVICGPQWWFGQMEL